MTKEQAAYAAALNRVGSDVEDGLLFSETLGRWSATPRAATGPHVDCPHCWWTTPCGGPDDGEHFADLWEHLIARHGIDTWVAAALAQTAWVRAVEEFEGAQAA
ncbi:hypothetical protein [Streptomyces sp. NRRL S-455]|uniref:hypothetical protein n=1 Tax=Streptomyces sp. NRRL S-455 TaxID=1463908 RepID=UPI0004BFF51B|nr:hypothetical protein [Streptomyces sp. NRRL S-455]